MKIGLSRLIFGPVISGKELILVYSLIGAGWSLAFFIAAVYLKEKE